MAIRRAAQFAFCFSFLLLCVFLFGITDSGQTLLRGRIPPTATHWALDDIHMGAGLAPWVYALVPSVLLALIGSVLLVAQRLRPH
jgi:hypothetical protein